MSEFLTPFAVGFGVGFAVSGVILMIGMLYFTFIRGLHHVNRV